MSIETTGRRGFRFGTYKLDTHRASLMERDEEIHLRPQCFEVLRYLVERQGKLVLRDELLDAVWGNKAVTGDSVTQCVIEIRKALGDHAHRTIATVPRRGYIFEAPVTPLHDTQPPAATDDAASRQGLMGTRRTTAAAALLIAAAAIWWSNTDNVSATQATPPPSASPPSIAVLPFSDMSAGGDHVHVTHGVAEEILHTLAQTPELIVIARTSSFAIANVDVATIGAVLDVDYVLDGSVRIDGDNLRVTAQLIDTTDSAHLWSRAWDSKIANLLDVQKQIAIDVARELRVSLPTSASVASVPAPAAVAYQKYLRGKYFYNRRGPGDLARAEYQLSEALRVDSSFADALILLVAANNIRITKSNLDVASILIDDEPVTAFIRRQQQTVDRMLRVAPTRSDAHARAAQFYRITGRQTVANRHAILAAELDPGQPIVVAWHVSALLNAGRLEEAIATQRSLIRTDPLVSVHYSNLGAFLESAGRFAEAETVFRQTIQIQGFQFSRSEVSSGAFGLARVLVLQGRFDDALAVASDWPDGGERLQVLGMIHHARGEFSVSDRGFEEFATATGGRSAWLAIEYFAFTDRHAEALDRLSLLAVDDSCPHGWAEEVYRSPFLVGLHDEPRMKAWRESVERAFEHCFTSGLTILSRRSADDSRGTPAVIATGKGPLPTTIASATSSDPAI